MFLQEQASLQPSLYLYVPLYILRIFLSIRFTILQKFV